MKTSKVGWTGKFWNVATGCTKVNALCDNCYMFRERERWGKDPTIVTKTGKSSFFSPQNNKVPTVYFTCGYTDFFHSQIDLYRDEAWEIIRNNPQHIFQILTKRVGRIERCLPKDWYSNFEAYKHVWIGASVGGADSDNVTIDRLLNIKASVLFLSIEPLINETDITKFVSSETLTPQNEIAKKWVIVGGESGYSLDREKHGYRMCKLDWFNEIVSICSKYNVPIFVKQLGCYLAKELGIKGDRTGAKIENLPQNLQIKQMPIDCSSYICNSNY